MLGHLRVVEHLVPKLSNSNKLVLPRLPAAEVTQSRLWPVSTQISGSISFIDSVARAVEKDAHLSNLGPSQEQRARHPLVAITRNIAEDRI